MKAFASSNYKLTTASSNLRLVLSLFLILTLFGLATNLVMTYRQTSFTPEGISTHYRGSEEPSDEGFAYPQSANELLMNSHFHLFMMPLTLLVLCHIFYMVSAPDGLKKALTWVAFVSMFVEIVAPWAIRFLSAAFALPMLLSSFFLAASMLVLIGAPLYEMWFKPLEAPDNNGAHRGPG